MTEFHKKCYVNGSWVGNRSDRTLTVLNPATNLPVGSVPDLDAEETEAAIAAARNAFTTWSVLPSGERSRYMHRIYDEMLKRKHDIAAILTMEQGKPLREALFEVEQAAEFVLWYAAEARRISGETLPASAADKRIIVLKQPVGVVSAIIPWNFPASMVTRKLAPAIAAGCTVVMKPAEQTPLTAAAIFEAIDAAGLPPGVANLVTGQPEIVGQLMTTHPAVQKVTFTGSTAVGKLLYRNGAETIKRLSLELGGHAPFIVFEDADLDAAAYHLVESKFRNNGQVCICPNRVYVHRNIAGQLADKVKQRMADLKIGNGMEPNVDIGPLIDDQGIQKVEQHVQDALSKGATLVCGGKRMGGPQYEQGNFYEPTLLLDANEDMLVAREETFGPVAPFFLFDTEEEVIARANNSDYGLAAYAFTQNIGRAVRVYEGLEYGIVGLNDALPTVPSAVQAPFGGMKQSGLGREGGQFGIEEFLEVKYVSLKI